ncbi:hypothetical protein EDM00_04945 [Ornithobacterium rhinotracheale]|uniref:hypothetical protein n=1 Tax=Ornithobacterium rhinotracheale TaxID=28251 RepID=UPI00129C1757|nr:hypothetical protein [Ornithobacterium rhinotracheale]MRI63342.1 hypothetical protein [Ornithobacterium rhinotracheale]MRJ08375.1 hypothetical protein [Ornithobacterium rhinotracheale]UOH77568.1 hypothetical protein MT996_10220 [Ornithobacterium rhinotracheale]
MKKTFLLLSFAVFSALNAQVAVERADVRGDGLIDFVPNDGRGLALPTLTSKQLTTQVGAMAFGAYPDTKGQLQAEIYYVNNQGKPVVLSSDAFLGKPDTGGKFNGKLQTPNAALSKEQGVIIGSLESDAKGVLIFESKDKAPILPQVEDPVNNIPSPEPGTICYDTKSKSLAVFDGVNWYFWKTIK